MTRDDPDGQGESARRRDRHGPQGRPEPLRERERIGDAHLRQVVEPGIRRHRPHLVPQRFPAGRAAGAGEPDDGE